MAPVANDFLVLERFVQQQHLLEETSGPVNIDESFFVLGV